MEILIFFIFGLSVGSFLNTVIYRLSKKEDFVFGRSSCPLCKHVLSWQDLVPVFSFLFLKGKCRYCGKPISWQYPLVELATGFLFALVVSQKIDLLLYYGLFGYLNICFLFIIFSLLIIIFAYDLKHYIIPDKVIYPAIALAGIWHLIFPVFFKEFLEFGLINVYSAFAAAGFFLAVVVLSKGKGMGVGDVKMAFFMGLFLGFPEILVALFLSFFLGAVIGTILIAFYGKTLKSDIPFGPFLVVGTIIALFFSQDLIFFYLSVQNCLF